MALAYDLESDLPEDRPVRMSRDLCDKKGAEWIRARIEEYWLARGFVPPQLEIRQQEFHPAVRSGRFDVRSDMIGGRPTKKMPAAIKTTID